MNFLYGKKILKTGSSRCSKVIVYVKQPPVTRMKSKFVVKLKAKLTKDQVLSVISEMKKGLDLDGKHKTFTKGDKTLNELEKKHVAVIERQLLEAIEKKSYSTIDTTTTDTSTFGVHEDLGSSLPEISLDYGGYLNEDAYFQIYAYGFFATKLVDHVVIYEDCPFDFMDIPGSGSKDVPLENIDSPILKQADLFILAKSCDNTSLKEEDEVFSEFLDTNALNKIIFVMTKADTLKGAGGLDEIENTFQLYRKKCSTRLHEKYYIVSCTDNVKGNQLQELRSDVYNIMQTGLWNEVRQELESIVGELKIVLDLLAQEFGGSFDHQLEQMIGEESLNKSGEKYQNIVSGANSLAQFEKISKRCKRRVNEMINTTSIYNMESFIQVLLTLFDENMNHVESSDSTNIRPGTIKTMMKQLSGGMLAIDEEKAIIKVREKSFRAIQKSLSECARKIGGMMHREFIMNWVKIISSELNVNASKFLTSITENEFSLKIESLIMHRASPVIEYYVRWAPHNTHQRSHLKEYLNDLGIQIDDKNPSENPQTVQYPNNHSFNQPTSQHFEKTKTMEETKHLPQKKSSTSSPTPQKTKPVVKQQPQEPLDESDEEF